MFHAGVKVRRKVPATSGTAFSDFQINQQLNEGISDFMASYSLQGIRWVPQHTFAPKVLIQLFLPIFSTKMKNELQQTQAIF